MPTCLKDGHGHTYTSTCVVEPTCIGHGVTKYTCSDCGHTYYEKIDELGHDVESGTCTRCGETKTDISGATVAEIAAQTYTGSAIMPTPTVTLDGNTLTKDTDYYINYYNNVEAGTATMKIIGKETYGGTIEKTFTINKAAATAPTAKTGLTYSGREITGVEAGEGYSLTDNIKTNAGAYTAIATLDSNHA